MGRGAPGPPAGGLYAGAVQGCQIGWLRLDPFAVPTGEGSTAVYPRAFSAVEKCTLDRVTNPGLKAPAGALSVLPTCHRVISERLRIFEPFLRIPPTISRVRAGTKKEGLSGYFRIMRKYPATTTIAITAKIARIIVMGSPSAGGAVGVVGVAGAAVVTVSVGVVGVVIGSVKSA